MKIYASNGKLYINGLPHDIPFPKIKVFDLLSGDEICPCKFADDETGEVEWFIKRGRYFVLDATGRYPRKERDVRPIKIEVERCLDPECVCCRHVFDRMKLVPNQEL